MATVAFVLRQASVGDVVIVGRLVAECGHVSQALAQKQQLALRALGTFGFPQRELKCPCDDIDAGL